MLCRRSVDGPGSGSSTISHVINHRRAKECTPFVLNDDYFSKTAPGTALYHNLKEEIQYHSLVYTE